MNPPNSQFVGFACAYTPLPLIHAAGFIPYRLLPVGDWPDQAGQVLHDSMCPHIKRLLDRAMSGDLPRDMVGMVFVNSCDAMRRLADAWHHVRPDERITLIDLPSTNDDTAVRYFTENIRRLGNTLENWAHRSVSEDQIQKSADDYDALSVVLQQKASRFRCGDIAGGSPEMQRLYNRAVSEDIIALMQELNYDEDPTCAGTPPEAAKVGGIPIFLFGNMLADPEVFGLLESCGATIAGDDFCTGSRMFSPSAEAHTGDIYYDLASRLLRQPPCARTMDVQHPAGIAATIAEAAKASGAAGAIGHVMKFCDPYLARLPSIRTALKAADMPVLILEGDCTLGSLGQQSTRIEAFLEMLR